MGGSASSVTLDPCCGDPSTLALVAALRTGRWQELKAVLRELSALAAWDDKAFLIGCISEVWKPEAPSWQAAWLQAEAHDPDALLVAGAHMIRHAWHARSGATIDQVSADRYAVFHSRLLQAEHLLARAASLAPGDPTVLAEQLVTARGLQLPADEAQRRFDAMIAIAPRHYSGHQAMLQIKCEKWGGSHEAMFAFAREAVARGGPGSGLAALAVSAHVERMVYMGMDERDPLAVTIRPERYFLQADVAAEVAAAAQASVLLPSFIITKQAVHQRNIIACALWRVGSFSAAGHLLRQLGNKSFTASPWQFFDDAGPQEAIALAKSACGVA